MPEARVRMIDVANAAGVSRTTASFILNGRDMNIPEATRQRVFEAAERMGYRKNATAVALVTGRTRRIGVVLNDPEWFDESDLFFNKLMLGITRGALESNYNVLLHTAQHGDWHGLLSDILSPAADGTLLVGRSIGDPLTHAVGRSNCPVVCISYRPSDGDLVSVDCDNESGGYVAARHLLDLGHTRLALIYPGERTSWAIDRRRGVERALEEHRGGGCSLELFAWPETRMPEDGWAAETVEALASRRPTPTGLICANETHANAILRALSCSGYRVPEHFSLISFNSTDLSARSTPPLTSVAQPLNAIGVSGVKTLIDLIEGRHIEERQLQFSMHLDVRDSTSAPRCASQ